MDRNGFIENVISFALIAFAALAPLVWYGGAASTFLTPKFTLLVLVALFCLASLALGAVWDGLHLKAKLVHYVLILFLVWVSLSTIFSKFRLTSLIGPWNYGEGLLSLFCYGIIFFSASSLQWSRQRLRALAVGLSIAAILISLLAVPQFLQYQTLLMKLGLSARRDLRISGTLGNPIFLGAFLLLSWPSVFVLYLEAKRWQERSWFGFLVCLLFFLNLATFSRAAWIGLIGGTLVTTILLGGRIIRYKQSRAVLALMGALAIVLLVSVIVLRSGYVGSLMGRASSVAAFGEGTAKTRVLNWAVALRAIRAKPILGWGPANYALGFDQNASLQLIRAEQMTVVDSHNLLLNTAATLGLPGLALLISIIALSLVRGIKRAREARNGLFFSALIAAIASYLIWAQFSPSSVGVTPVFWLFLGITVSPQSREDGIERKLSPQLKQILSFLIIVFALAMCSLPIRYFVADVYYLRGSVIENETDLLASVRFNPWMPLYYHSLGTLYLKQAKQGDQEALQQSFTVLQRALKLSPDFESRIRLASAYAGQAEILGSRKDYDSAILHLKEAMRLRPLSAIAHYNLALCHFKLGEYVKALSELRKTKRIAPRDVETLILIGRCYERLGKREKALKAYQEVLRIDSGQTEAKDATKRLK